MHGIWDYRRFPFSIIRYIGVNIKSGTVQLVILVLDVRRTVIYYGTGCTLPSAIAAYIAGEYAACDAVVAAKEYISIAIQYGFSIGKGAVGPTHYFYDL